MSSRLIGKVNSEHGQCYVPLGEDEVANSSYEILVAFSPARAGPTTEPSPILVTNPLNKIYSSVTALPLTQDPGRTSHFIHDKFLVCEML